MTMLALSSLALLAAAVTGSTCPEKTCGAHREGTERSLNVPWQLSQIEDFGLAPTLLDLFNRQIHLEMQAWYTYESMATFFDRDDVAMKGFGKLFADAAGEELDHARAMMKFVNERGGGVTFGSLVTPCLNDLLSTDLDTPAADNRRCKTVEAKYSTSASSRPTVEGHVGCDWRDPIAAVTAARQAKYSTSASSRPTVEGHVGCDWRDPIAAVTAARQVELNVWRQLKVVHRHADKLGDVNAQDFLEAYIAEGQTATKEMAELLTRLRRVEPCVGHHLIDQELLKA